MIVETKKLNKSSSFDIHSPIAVAGIRGTAFRLRADDNGQSLDVIRGQVDCQQGRGRVTSVIGGQANTATKGRISDLRISLPMLVHRSSRFVLLWAKKWAGVQCRNFPRLIILRIPPCILALGQMVLKPPCVQKSADLGEKYYRKITTGSARIFVTNGANIKDIRFVQRLRNLKKVTLVDQPISDLSPLSTCTQLREVGLSNLRKVTSIKPLESMTNLKT